MNNEIEELREEINKIKKRVLFLERKEKDRKVKGIVKIILFVLIIIVSIFYLIVLKNSIGQIVGLI